MSNSCEVPLNSATARLISRCIMTQPILLTFLPRLWSVSNGSSIAILKSCQFFSSFVIRLGVRIFITLFSKSNVAKNRKNWCSNSPALKCVISFYGNTYVQAYLLTVCYLCSRIWKARYNCRNNNQRREWWSFLRPLVVLIVARTVTLAAWCVVRNKLLILPTHTSWCNLISC